jgi:2-oxoglutarate dehydrogenase E2 component (dihydrolipoamide succinyltransferase)
VAAPAPKSIGSRTQRAVPLSPVRIRTNQRLKEIQSTYALLTTFQEIDMSNLIQMRKKYGEEYEKKFGSKLSFLSVFVRASISALQARPIVNAVIEGNDIVYRDYIDVSVSVASSSGVVCLRIFLAPSTVSSQQTQFS